MDRLPKSENLQSAADVIDALGGTGAFAALLDVGASAVSNYRKNGFPARLHVRLAQLCKREGLQVNEAVFGGLSAAPAKTPRRAAWAGQAEAGGPLALFQNAGFEAMDTPVLQPAEPFIDRMGAEMQRRLYRFTDPAGEALCLRPDLTIPTALAYLTESRTGRARLCYQGTAFRYQPRGAGKPEEFTQTGIEIIGGHDGMADDAEIVSLLVQAVQQAGVRDFTLTLIDFSRFDRQVDEMDFSPAIARRLKQIAKQSDSPKDMAAHVLAFINRLDARNTQDFPTPPPPDARIAGRSGRDIAERLQQQQLDMQQARADRDRLDEFVRRAAQGDYREVSTLPPSLRALRGALLEKGIPADRLVFESISQQKMAYYTGLSFELRVPELGNQQVIASGGRYDDLLQSLGADRPVAAVGGAIALERLVLAASLQGEAQ